MSDAPATDLSILWRPFHPSSIEPNEDGKAVVSGRALEQRLGHATMDCWEPTEVVLSERPHAPSLNQEGSINKQCVVVHVSLWLELPGLKRKPGYGEMLWFEGGDYADSEKGAMTAAVRAAANRHGVGTELWPECAAEQWLKWLRLLRGDVDALTEAGETLLALRGFLAHSYDHWNAWQWHWPRVCRLWRSLVGDAEVVMLDEVTAQEVTKLPMWDVPAPPKPIKGMKPRPASFEQTCFACHRTIAEGEMSYGKQFNGRWKNWHEDCLTPESLQEAEQAGGGGGRSTGPRDADDRHEPTGGRSPRQEAEVPDDDPRKVYPQIRDLFKAARTQAEFKAAQSALAKANLTGNWLTNAQNDEETARKRLARTDGEPFGPEPAAHDGQGRR